jgi:integrase/predicted RNA-binding Zn-ribbon protein involved in translation (DUF1610 family)
MQTAAPLACPSCGGTKLYRDGIRYLADGSQTQRWLCRNCGFRFSENAKNGQRHNKSCRVGAPKPGVKNSVAKAVVLADTNGKSEQQAAGATEQTADIKGKLVQFMFQLANDGINEATIQNYIKTLKLLLKYGADLSNPESVKEVIAKQKRWSESTKALAAIVYGKFADLNKIKWKPPSYKPNRKVPFIPLESELDALIASCGKKLSALLRLLKETGIRVGEALKLEWKDLDVKNKAILLNSTEKHGVCRVVNVSEELMAMLNSLPKTSDRIFGNRHLSSWEGSFSLQRRKAAVKLQNPRLIQIHFHTFRHWKATMEYAKTKDILHVMKVLGHRSLQNTLLYTQLINFETNEYHSATAKTVEEARQLIEAGFEYVCEIDNVQLFRKRK